MFVIDGQLPNKIICLAESIYTYKGLNLNILCRVAGIIEIS